MSGEFLKSFLSIENVFTRYILGVAILLLIIFLLKYISRTLQWTTEKILSNRQIIGKGWISLIIKHKVLDHLFFAIGLCFLVGASELILTGAYPKFTTFLLRLINIVIIVKFTLLITACLSVVGDKYARSFKMPVKGIVQAIQVVCWLVSIILMVSIIVNKEPVYLLGGLTALSAMLLLIFKDSILGPVSGFQLSLNDLVRVGDWIVIPGQGADGEVVDICLPRLE
ncbi:MAG: mechanosensitive ion channel family protein, partial [Campylobacter sp.]|nr:mechanosensitive ion channel family protein [Campylobacter sp.]